MRLYQIDELSARPILRNSSPHGYLYHLANARRLGDSLQQYENQLKQSARTLSALFNRMFQSTTSTTAGVWSVDSPGNRGGSYPRLAAQPVSQQHLEHLQPMVAWIGRLTGATNPTTSTTQRQITVQFFIR